MLPIATSPDLAFVRNSYVVSVPIANGWRRYFSTLLRSIVDLDLEHQTILEGCGQRICSDARETSILEQLRDLGLVRHQSENEFDCAYALIKRWRRIPFLAVDFCLTFRCNFKCAYCYEEGHWEERNQLPLMSPAVATASLTWMASIIHSEKIEGAKITFFGGEPLLQYPLIVDIMRQIPNELPNVPLRYFMSTNGYLLSDERISALGSLGLERLQTTLDGLPDTHNKRRPTRGGKGTFQEVFENLTKCLRKGFTVDLLTVCDAENYRDLLQLIDLVYDALGAQGATNIVWSFSLVEPTDACLNRSQLLLLGREQEIAFAVQKAREYAFARGFHVSFPYGSNVCGRQLKYGFGIGPGGEVYKCFGGFGNAHYRIGTIFEPIDWILAQSEAMCDLDVFDSDCKQCELFPICRGAMCQYTAAHLFGGGQPTKHCDKEFLLTDIGHVLRSDLTIDGVGR